MLTLSAREAKFKSINGKKYAEIEKWIEKAILKTAEEGHCSCNVSIDIGTPAEIRERIKCDLSSLGYAVKITDYAAENKDCPCDQAIYYDTIYISWDN